jgi:hypothetical protein
LIGLPTKEAIRRESNAICAEALSVTFMAAIVAAANLLQLGYVLFPELGALSSDVLLRPQGKWAKVPWQLIATPTLTAVLGIAVGRIAPYGVIPILFTMVASIGIIRFLRSAVAPAISAGVLPIVLGVTSWLYPLCILGTLTALTALLLLWRTTPIGKGLSGQSSAARNTVEVLESPPQAKGWFVALFGFVAIMGGAAQFTGWRFLLFPPLIVIAYEMLGHPETCPWAKRPFVFPMICSVAALAGVESVLKIGVNPVSSTLVLAMTLVLLRVCKLRMPPALAIGLIPFVMSSPTPNYAVSVLIGTLALTLWFLAFRKLILRTLK